MVRRSCFVLACAPVLYKLRRSGGLPEDSSASPRAALLPTGTTALAMLNLEEKLLEVRSPRARQDIREAIACYAAGAYRAAIVMTWTAVVFDIMEKLRELELTGDKNAKKQVEAFESIRVSNDVKRSQDW